MKRRIVFIYLALVVALTLVLASTTMVVADKGGVPNGKSANGAAHANENSAHYTGDDFEPPY